MTIIVAGNTGEEIYFCSDAIRYWHWGSRRRKPYFDDSQKVRAAGRDDVAIGFAGEVGGAYEAFQKKVVGSNTQPVEAARRFALAGGFGDDTDFLAGMFLDGKPVLLAYERAAGGRLRQVDVYGIGSGMFPEVVKRLHEGFKAGIDGEVLRLHLRDVVMYAKEVEKNRISTPLLFGLGEARLGPDGFEPLAFESAIPEYLQEIIGTGVGHVPLSVALEVKRHSTFFYPGRI